jgi:hypothetical protein
MDLYDAMQRRRSVRDIVPRKQALIYWIGYRPHALC